MLILNTITMTYHYFRLKGIKSLSSEIDEKSKDHKENMNYIISPLFGAEYNIDNISEQDIESYSSLYKNKNISYLKLFNIQYFGVLALKALILAFVTLVSMAIFGAVLGPIIKIVIGLEIIICMHDFYIGMKEKGMNK